MAVKNFQKEYSYGYCGIRPSKGNLSLVTTLAGSSGCPDRARKPRPLTDTLLSIERTINNGNYSYEFTTGSGDRRFGSAFYVFLNVPVITTQASNKPGAAPALARALSRFHRGDVDLGQSLGELRKTVASVASDSRKLADLVEAVTQGNIPKTSQLIGRNLSKAERRAMNASKAERVSSMWLNLNYNYRQLADDIYNSVKEYGSTISTVGDEVKSSSGGRPARPNNSPNGSNHSAVKLDPPGPTKYPDTEAGVFGNGGRLPDAYATVRGTVTNAAAAELNRLGLLNPMALSWELLPFSFVADWCANIGDILRSMTAGLGFSPLRTSVVTEARQTRTVNGVWQGTYQSIARTGGSANIASVTPGMLQVHIKPTLAKATNALALVTQQVLRSAR